MEQTDPPAKVASNEWFGVTAENNGKDSQMSETIDTMNKFGVSLLGERIALLLPIPHLLSRSEALTLAAWLVVLADNRVGEAGGEFQRVLKEVCNS